MKWHTIAGFGRKGSDTLPGGNWVAAAIASSSEVDLCSIGGQRLGPLAIVPCNGGGEVKAIRGYRTGSADLTELADEVGGTLVLQLYEPCDLLVPPGPRAPLVVSTRAKAIGADAANATLLLRLPFSGRSKGSVKVSRSASGADATIVIRGVSYLTREELRLGAEADGDQALIDEQVETLGTTTSSLNANDKLAGTFYVGGDGDNREFFDELEVWAYGTTSLVNAQAEASGERGF